MTSTRLTDARQSLWDALTNWPATSSWKRYLAEGDPNLQNEKGPTSRQDLPAVRITPTRVQFAWETQLYMQYDYVLDVTVWRSTLAEIEASMQDVWEAIIRCHPDDSTVPYTRAALSKTPEQIGVQFGLRAIGKDSKLLVWVGIMTVGLITTDMPHSA